MRPSDGGKLFALCIVAETDTGWNILENKCDPSFDSKRKEQANRFKKLMTIPQLMKRKNKFSGVSPWKRVKSHIVVVIISQKFHLT
jgi:hypothetical protein